MDKKTAEKLYEAFYMKVFSYVMTLTNDQDEAMEITQETFFRAISTDKEFRGESKSYTWLCAIAKNLWGMLLGRLFVGTGMGIGPPVAALYVAEV